MAGFQSYTGSTYPLLLNAFSVEALYGINDRAYYFVIDANGIIRYRSTGSSYTTRYDPVALAAVIDQWLALTAVDPGDRGGVPDVKPGARSEERR